MARTRSTSAPANTAAATASSAKIIDPAVAAANVDSLPAHHNRHRRFRPRKNSNGGNNNNSHNNNNNRGTWFGCVTVFLQRYFELPYYEAEFEHQQQQQQQQQQQEDDDNERMDEKEIDNVDSNAVDRFTKESLVMLLERIVLWEDPFDTFIYVLAFNVVYWGVCLFHLNGLLAVCSAAGIITITTISTVEYRDEQALNAFRAKVDCLEKICKKCKDHLLYAFDKLCEDSTMTFCLLLLLSILSFVTFVSMFDPVIFFYALFMSVFVVPPVCLYCFGEQPSSTEQDGEITEFLPEATEDNLQVLKRAGESGDSPTPSNSNSANGNSSTVDNLDVEDLEGLNMPSHEYEDESADELSDIEFQPGDTDTDGVPRKRRRYQDSSASSDGEEYDEDEDDEEEDETEQQQQHGDAKHKKKLDRNSKHLDVERSDNSSSGDDDDDFEIIDERELEELKNV